MFPRGRPPSDRPFLSLSRDASGVHQLASLLLELDASDETSQLLCADALYQMDRVDEAQKILLVALSNTSQRSAILARLALLQLKKGFLYDCNQVRKYWVLEGKLLKLKPTCYSPAEGNVAFCNSTKQCAVPVTRALIAVYFPHSCCSCSCSCCS